MRKVLLISPSFPPVNAADMHRARQCVPHLRSLGWDCTVAAVKPELNESPKDPLLCHIVPKDLKILWLGALPFTITRKFGFGTLAIRSWWHYAFGITSHLYTHTYDLIFFSTTMFPIVVLGRVWKALFGIPYVVDIQDMWHNTYYEEHPSVQRPKKYKISYTLNKFFEPFTLKKAAGIITVSEQYTQALLARYPNHLKKKQILTLPFAVVPEDFSADLSVVSFSSGVQQILEALPSDSLLMVYTGRGGDDMQASVVRFYEFWQMGLKHTPEVFGRLMVLIVGTSYDKTGGKQTLAPLSNNYALAEKVFEIPNRIGYFEAIKLMKRANALLLVSSDAPSYNASKLQPYLISKKPVLAVVPSMGEMYTELCKHPQVMLLPMEDAVQTEIYERTLLKFIQIMSHETSVVDTSDVAYDAKIMSQKLASFFETIV